ncbi:MAG: transporter substrate-binding protein [Polaromonas sp.]|nr:transporter substrate-binding protein [Polaromonas sp.]
MRRRTLIQAATSISMPSLISNAFAQDAGVTAREIVVGQNAVTSGPSGEPMQGFNAGARLAFNAINSQGGIHGRQIRYVCLDDGLNIEKTVANYKTLLTEHHAFAFFGAIGTANTAAALPILRESNAPMIGCLSVGDSVREKATKMAYFVRAGFAREAARLVGQLTSIGITRISVAHFAVPGGVEVLGAVRAAIKAQNPTWDVVQSVSIKPDGSDVVEAGTALGKGNAQAIIMQLSSTLVAELIKSVQKTGATRSFYGLSIVDGEVVAKALGSQIRGLAVSQVVPFPWSQSDPTAREYRQRITAQKLPINYYSYEGYINGLVMIEALRRAGKSPTREILHTVMRGLNASIGGMDLDFTSSSTGSQFVELVHVTTDGRFVR